MSADDTKSPGPLDDTCKFSTSPKSLIKDLEDLHTKLCDKINFGELNPHWFTLFTYSKVLVSIIIFSPLPTKGGTLILIPQSKIAGL